MAATRGDRLRALLARCHDDPSLFNAAILGGAKFWWRQEEMCRLVVENHTSIIAAGNSVGKSHWLARIVLWWLCTRPGSLVVTTAPSHDQLDGVLWKNIRQAVEQSAIPLGIELRAKPLRARLGEGWQAIGIATTKIERVSGHHNPHLLAVADEGSGVAADIKEGLDSLVPRRFIAIGNPIRPDGWFRDAYEQGERQAMDPSIPAEERVASLRVPSTDSPDIHLPHSNRGLASGGWLRRMHRQYGENSLWTRTHIDARFPEASAEVFIPVDWLDAAATAACPDRRVEDCGPRRIGCDLGEGVGKDRTVVLVRDDRGILEIRGDNGVGLPEAARLIAELAAKYNVAQERITWDGNGIGTRMPPHLKGYGIEEARPYFGGRKLKRLYVNLRTAAAWAMRDRLNPAHRLIGDLYKPQLPFHIPCGPWWQHLREELKALEYSLDDSDKSALISKEDLKEKLGRSPDYADALIQTFSY